MAERAEVLAYAAAHGAKQAADHFGIPPGTVRSWRHRARQRAARLGQPNPYPTPAERWLAEARQLAERYLAGQCVQCGGSGSVDVPATTRGGLPVRKARRIPCPSCGGPVRRVQVNELGRREWAEGMRVAGDLGLGWSPDEWRLIRAGEVDPDGRRWTGRPDAS
jgi:transposase-like protein